MQQPDNSSIYVFLVLCWVAYSIRISWLMNSWRQRVVAILGGLLPVAGGAFVSAIKGEPISAFAVAVAGAMVCLVISTLGWGSRLRKVYALRDSADVATRNSAEWPKGFIRISVTLITAWIVFFVAVSTNWR